MAAAFAVITVININSGNVHIGIGEIARAIFLHEGTEKDLEIITSVHCRGNGVHVDIAPKLEGVALEGNLVRIDLRTQSCSPGNAFYRICKAMGYQHSGRRDYLRVFEGIYYA